MTVSQQSRPPLAGGPEPGGFRLTGKAYAFSIAFVSAVGGFLFGYDLAIMGGANVSLQKLYGLSEGWFGFTTASATLGCIVGPFFGAWLCDRVGRRTTLIAACLLLAIGSIFTAIPDVVSFAPVISFLRLGFIFDGIHSDIVTFNVFRIVGGLGVGLCSIASPMYTNEIAPARWRGGLGFMYQLAIVVGSVAAAAAAWGIGDWLPKEVSWRWMFASEVLPVAVFVALLFLVPESPRWLAQRGRFEEARKVFTRIDGPQFADTELTQVQSSLTAESGALSELFGAGLRMALFVGLCLALFNNFTGWSAMGGYVTDLFLRQGLTESDARLRYVLSYGFMGLMTLLACGLVDRMGRRPLWIISALVMVGANIAMGLVFHWRVSGGMALAALFLCTIPHSFALGPLPWLMMSEIFPTRIRARAVAVTTAFIWTVGFIASYTFPLVAGVSERYMGKGDIAGAFWFYAGVCVLAFLFGVTIMPETKGKTLEEIGDSWKKSKGN